MAGETDAPVQTGAVPTASAGERPPASEQDKQLAKDWLKRIEHALKRVPVETFDRNRKLLAGRKDAAADSQEKVRANLHFGNMAALIPQIYAKDPEFAASPTRAVDPKQMEAAKAFAATAEFMLHKLVVKDAGLKKQAKKGVRSTFTTSIAWLKASWQERKKTDPQILNRIKDTQDNIERVQTLLATLEDADQRGQEELNLAKLREALAGLETQQEVVIAKGVAIDFCMSEDVIVIDPSVLAVTDYTRAAAMAHRVWMTPEQYRATFGYAPTQKAKVYAQQSGGKIEGTQAGTDKATTLVCVWEVWSQEDNRIFYVCDGEEGFCKPPSSPEWTGKRWYPFFLLAFNEIDGSFYPLSDIELTEKLVKEYNESREDFVRDRRECLPINIARKGGSLTDADLKAIKNRRGGDLVMVEGVGGQPISNDIWSGALGQIKPENYDTTQSRYDMERILGGSDATTGSITHAKTATEAKILTQGLLGRTGERQDTLEDMLNELGPYCVEMMLRKLTEAEVKAMAGPEATWPQMSIEQIFNLVTIEVRSGSTGKPDEQIEQETWTKLLPIINEAAAKVAELREKGQEALAQAVIEITRETLRRFDERLDIEQFLPKQPADANDPIALTQQNAALKNQNQELMTSLQDAQTKVERGYVQAWAQIATSDDPVQALAAFRAAETGQDPSTIPPPLPPAPKPAAPAGEHEQMPEGAEPPGQPEDSTPEPGLQVS